MRRLIQLYIGGQLVDIDDKALVLMNYTAEDLLNPTIVKNSYSQTVTLKGTPINNTIFGDIFKLDRQTLLTTQDSGIYFDASKKTPFQIINDRSEMLESGYMQLQDISVNGQDISYKIGLFGGLGSFFYSLSYNEDGNKKTLASLKYLPTGTPSEELNFRINKTNVAAAWARLKAGVSKIPESIWDVLNFAPAYNGVPDKNFNANKGLAKPEVSGLMTDITIDSVDYTTKNGYTLVTMTEGQTEWAVKDLRSYLQRPVLSVDAFLNAIKNKDINGGYEVDTSQFQQKGYQGMWITLPMIPSLTGFKSVTKPISYEYIAGSSASDAVNDIAITSPTKNIPVKVDMSMKLQAIFENPDQSEALYTIQTVSYDNNRSWSGSACATFIQMVAEDGQGNVVGGSKVWMVGTLGLSSTPQVLAGKMGYVPRWEGEDVWSNPALTDTFIKTPNDSIYETDKEMSFSFTAIGAERITIYADTGTYDTETSRQWWEYRNQTTESNFRMNAGGRNTLILHSQRFVLVPESQPSEVRTKYLSCDNNTLDVYDGSPSSARSNALVTKDLLLNTRNTPAEYLLSLCKIFGFYFVFDGIGKKITLTSRNNLYKNEVMDIDDRIDRGKGMKIKPFLFDSKWYDMSLPSKGDFADEYRQLRGRDYGSQRINTNYDFNSSVKNLTDKVVFGSGVTSLEFGKYYNQVEGLGYTVPSPFLDEGVKQTLWSNEDKKIDLNIPPQGIFRIDEFNPATPGYDAKGAEKIQFHDASGKPTDGANVLVMFNGFHTQQGFKLTDDIYEMEELNNGVPCWMLDIQYTSPAFEYPVFSREKITGDSITQSLEMGYPAEINIPIVKYGKNATIYDRYWKKYIADRYDINTKVVRCWVDWKGKVDAENLRRFYWFDNAVWALNKVVNYSITQDGATECEFVKVNNIDNYTEGQI